LAGLDSVLFMLSANAGEKPQSLHLVASGGERSRVLLALKAAIGGGASTQRAPLAVFDEIDAGVGARIGTCIGSTLQQIAAGQGTGKQGDRVSSGQQVLCVTHLPQVAAYADHHLTVSKGIDRQGERTVMGVSLLEGDDARLAELSNMGGLDNAAARDLVTASKLSKSN